MTVTLHHGDCLEQMRAMPAASVDSIVTDPPYELGFMGKGWDRTGIANDVEMWRAAYACLKPGGHLLAFSGSRTYHRMVCAIEDAGFEIRDQIMWVYSSGFPKSHNLDNHRGEATCGCESTSQCDVRSMFDGDIQAAESAPQECGQVLQSGLSEQGASAAGRAQLSASEIGCAEPGLEGRRDDLQEARQLHGSAVRAGTDMGAANGAQGRLLDGASPSDGSMVRLPADANGGCASHRPRPNAKRTAESGTVAGQQEPQARGAWPLCRGCGKPILPRGLGSALKPAHEPIVVARKPLIGTVASNVLAHGTGALNIDGCRVPTGDTLGGGAQKSVAVDGKHEGWARPWMRDAEAVVAHAERVSANVAKAESLGRWPANLIHDSSDEVLAAFQQAPGQQGVAKNDGSTAVTKQPEPRGDMGSAARFFYCAKASKRDRGEGNMHPTVKPTELMRYLCRLVTPPGGVVLDPFMGSGSTGKAAVLEGFRFIGIEREAEYLAIARARIDSALEQVEANTTLRQPDLFAGAAA